MLKNLAELEVTVEGKVCRFLCESDTPTTYIKEALFQFQKCVGTIEDYAKANQEKQAEKEGEVKQEAVEACASSEQSCIDYTGEC